MNSLSFSNHIIIGANGQVGSSLMKLLGDKAVGLTEKDLDLSQPDTVKGVLQRYSPDVIINAAAYTAVDKTETEEELALLINATSVGKIAEYAFENNISFVHYSTDYVFLGTGITPWKEDDNTAPLNAYGRTKLAGEKAIINAVEKYPDAKWLIFRTSWVYNEIGANFVNTMLRLGKERDELSIINDQIGAPTYAGDIAKYTLEALNTSENVSGIYHLCNSGETSWYGFAKEIFELASSYGIDLKVKKLNEIGTSDYPTPAIRPLNSRLDLNKLHTVFGIETPHWKDALDRCLRACSK